MQKPGDKVKVVTAEQTFEGTLMPNEETDALVLKLTNGYNIGIDKKSIKKIQVLEAYKPNSSGSHPIKANPSLPTISILHTGGTIASKVDYQTGGVIARFEPEELLGNFPELDGIANIKSRLVSRMFSEDIRFIHYQLMIKAIKEEIAQGVDGIILTHGTDTLGYSAAALAFAIENSPIPILLVGAQRSSDRGSSDAAMNLICAASFITKTDFSGVAICMHWNTDDRDAVILPPCKTRKLHSSRRDAFRAVNDTPIAKVSYPTKQVTFLKKDYLKKDKARKPIIKDKFSEKVAIVKIHPNMVPKQFSFFKGYQGLVIEGTGLGHAPVGIPNEHCKIHGKILKAIRELAKKGTVAVMTSQTIFGRVAMHVYSNAIALVNAGVIPGEDMLTETAFIKLSWLLGNYKDKGEVKKLIGANLRGEINERLPLEKFPTE